MLIPKPKESQTKEKFISKFLSDEKMIKEFRDIEQRLVVANSTWEEFIKKNNNIDNNVSILKQDNEKRLIYGIVLQPNIVDGQGDIMSVESIEKACHFFMENSQVIGAEHYKEVPAKVVESYIAPTDFILNENEVKKGTWILVTKILNDPLWTDIKEGKYTGYSIGGYGKRTNLA